MREYRQLSRYLAWADAETWRAVLALPAARRDVRLTEWLHHIHVVQWAYLEIWRGQMAEIPELGSFADLAEILVWGRQYHSAASDCLDRLAERWAAPVRVPWADQFAGADRPVEPATLADSFFQVALHSAYHRGQVNARLRELGGEPPLVDFIAWIWRGRPEADWPSHGREPFA